MLTLVVCLACLAPPLLLLYHCHGFRSQMRVECPQHHLLGYLHQEPVSAMQCLPNYHASHENKCTPCFLDILHLTVVHCNTNWPASSTRPPSSALWMVHLASTAFAFVDVLTRPTIWQLDASRLVPIPDSWMLSAPRTSVNNSAPANYHASHQNKT